MIYQPRNFDNLLGIGHLSNKLLKDHFFLYQGYVNNTNKLLQELEMLSKEGLDNTSEYAEMKRRFGWEWNAARLHELYFSGMTKIGFRNYLDRNTNLYKKIVEDFGSYDNWERDFKSTGLIRGIGWVILYLDPLAGESGRLFNIWIENHATNHLCTAYPILILDVFEHSYMLDYGTNKKDYIDAFFKIIDWATVSSIDKIL